MTAYVACCATCTSTFVVDYLARTLDVLSAGHQLAALVPQPRHVPFFLSRAFLVTCVAVSPTLQLSREQTGFVEGVWQERRRLEAELGARGQEVERLRASEDAARAAAKALENRAEDLSVALRRGQAQAKHDAQAAAAASTRDAMEALRRQLDDLRREVDRTCLLYTSPSPRD